MSSHLGDPKTADPDQNAKSGLNPDELRAEQAGELPDRDAMSIIGVGGFEGGLPPAGLLDDLLDTDLPVPTLPVGGLPVEQYPIDRLPVDPLPPETLPVEPIDGGSVDQPIENPIIVSDLPAASAETTVEA
jgi:hypothetical protein